MIIRPTSASAAETCDFNVVLNGYKEVYGPFSGVSDYGPDYSMGISVWLRKSDRAKMVMIEDRFANGQRNVLGTATSTSNVLDSNLGSTQSIPPGQAWCSSLTKAKYITGRMTYHVGRIGYAQAVYWGP